MTLLESLRQRLLGIRTKAQTTAASAYWRAVDAVAQGQEPKVRDDDLLESMQALGKTEDDIDTDAQLLADLKAQEAILATKAATEKNAARLAKEAADLTAEASRLRAAADKATKDAEERQTNRRLAMSSIEAAEREAERLRRQLANRGHQKLRDRVDADDAERECAARLEGLEVALRRAKAELDVAERDLAEAIEDGKREAPKRMVDGELVPDERHLPSVEIWQSARDRKAEAVDRLTREIAETTKATEATPTQESRSPAAEDGTA